MAANPILKFAVAGAVLMLGLSAPAFAAPRDQECTDCPISNKYDSEEVVEKIKRIKKTLANEEPIDVRAGRTDYETGHIRHSGRGSHRGTRTRHSECADCAPRRNYDSREIVKKIRDIDRSRVIDTQTVVPVYVQRIPVRTTVVFVTHHYRVVERPDSVTVPAYIGPQHRRDCGRGYGRTGSCRSLLRVRG